MATTNETPERAPRRQMLALITLLTELPTPTKISFSDGILALDFECVAAGQAWAVYLGARTEPYVKDNIRWLGDRSITVWNGWRVQLYATDDVAPDTSLEEETAAQLRALADPDGGDRDA